jgi:hypothetical protein
MLQNNIINFVYQNPYALFAIATWTIVWKGLALWKASKKDAKVWFVLLLVINTIGILELLYYFFLSKVDFNKIFGNLGSKIKNIKK